MGLHARHPLARYPCIPWASQTTFRIPIGQTHFIRLDTGIESEPVQEYLEEWESLGPEFQIASPLDVDIRIQNANKGRKHG